MHTVTSGALSPTDFADIANLVLERSAIVLESSKAYLIESRLAPVARRNQFASIAELAEAMRRTNSHKLQAEIVDAMTTNETSFFRDIHPFELLKKQILPELVARRAHEKRLTVWSNACSSGQEIYSIAMLIREHFPALDGWNIRLWGTDLSSEILERARAGVFNQTEVNRGLPIPLLTKYFRRDGIHWVISSDIRSMVRFEPVNLIESWPSVLTAVDIVFLRNVLIYFSTDTKRKILCKVRQCISDDGVLFLGGSETIMRLTDAFEQIQVSRSIYYKPI
jgi:chemotaxis protein methyltransferase CheR